MILTPSGMEVWGSFFVVVLLLKISHRRGLQVLRLVSVPEFGTAKGVGPDFSSCCCHLIPGTLLLLRNMHFLLVSSDFWLWLWGREEVFYSIIYFQKSNFEIAGLLVGSVLLKLTLEGPGEGRKEGCGAGSWELVLRLRTHSMNLAFHSVLTNLSYLIFQRRVEVLTELHL